MTKAKPNDNSQLMMLNCMILSRTKEAKAANEEDRFDEETDAYLESLRKAFADPDRIEVLTPYLFSYDIEVLERLAHSDDSTVRYLICKAKDDILILAVAVFDEAGEAALPVGPPFKHGSQGQMGRGPVYFHYAFAYSRRVGCAREAMELIEEGLPLGIEKYAAILAYVTNEPVTLADRFAACETYHLVRSVERTNRRIRLERKQNEFLDAYREWKANHTQEARLKMTAAADELKRLDPNFSYTPEAQEQK
jgi:hypothetical protein